MWLGPESNQRHMDFQSTALPTELPSHTKLKKGSQNYPMGWRISNKKWWPFQVFLFYLLRLLISWKQIRKTDQNSIRADIFHGTIWCINITRLLTPAGGKKSGIHPGLLHATGLVLSVTGRRGGILWALFPCRKSAKPRFVCPGYWLHHATFLFHDAPTL